MKKLTLLIIALLVSYTSFAQAPKLPIDPGVKYGKLENGLTYYVRHNKQPEKRADFYIAQKVGSMQEEDSQAGLAHFLEHMAFNGSKNFKGRKALTGYLESIGAKFGVNSNAYTSFDETVYTLMNIPVTRQPIIDSCLLILHDWSGFLDLEDKEIDKERPIIKEEWRTRDNAGMRILEKQLADIYKGSKYADRLPIGKMEVVENFEYQVLRDYYHKWYRPDLQAIIIVGDIDADAVEKKIKEIFADIPKAVDPAERVYFPVADNDEPIVSVVTDKESMSYNVAVFYKHDIVPFEMRQTEMGLVTGYVKNLISMMMSDRLQEIAMNPDSPFLGAQAYDGEYFVAKSKDAFSFFSASKEGKINETLASLVREAQRAKQFGFTDAELERAKARVLSSLEDQFNNKDKQMNRSYVQEYVRSFSDYEPIPGIAYELEMFKRYSPMLTAEAINKTVASLIGDKNMVITVTGPEKEDAVYPTKEKLLAVVDATKAEKLEGYVEEISNDPLVTDMPKAGKVVKEEKNEKLGTVLWTLSNGMKVGYKKTDYKDDEILVRGRAYGGSSLLPESEIYNAELGSGIAGICGLGNYNAVNLNKRLAGSTANVNSYFSKTEQGVNASSNKKDLETMFQLMYLSFTSVHDDAQAFEAVKGMVVGQLKNLENNPKVQFSDSLNYQMYGNNPRYKRMKLADAEKLDYAKAMDAFKKSFANPGSFAMSFVGTIDAEELKPLVEQYLASLPSGKKDAKYAPLNYGLQKGLNESVFSKKMENARSSVRYVLSADIKRNTPNEVAFNGLKQILDIVYTRTVREEAGGTYGVGVGASIRRLPDGEAQLHILYDTDPEKYNVIDPIIERELNKIVKEGVDDEDFQKVKEYMIKQHQEDVKTNKYWLSVVDDLYFYNEDSHSDYSTSIEALKKEDIQKILKDFLSQKNKVKVVMQPEK